MWGELPDNFLLYVSIWKIEHRQLHKIENNNNIIFRFFQFSFSRLQNFPGTNGSKVHHGPMYCRGEVLQLKADCEWDSSDVTKFKAYYIGRFCVRRMPYQGVAPIKGSVFVEGEPVKLYLCVFKQIKSKYRYPSSNKPSSRPLSTDWLKWPI
jgi:hypothetical protein